MGSAGFSSSGSKGFTLVELIVVILITGVLAMVLSPMIQGPIESYRAQARRAQLVDIADTALRRMSREIREALPNSVRVSDGSGDCPRGRCLEFLHTSSGGRYRARPGNNPMSLSFDPSDNDTRLQVLGFLEGAGSIRTGSDPADCRDGLADCLVVYNTGHIGTDAYGMDNAATITDVDTIGNITIDFDNTLFSSGNTAFPAASPQQRFYIVDTPVSYLCDLGQGSIRRYQGYNIRPAQGSVDTHAEITGLSNPAENALLADRVSNCDFSYDPGSFTRNGLLSMNISIQDGGELVTLQQQVHVSNVP